MKYFLITFLLLTMTLFAQNGKPRIAVLQLQALGISQSEGVTLAERLHNELVKTGSFIVLERAEMDEILKEQGIQLSGCTSNECAVEAGRLLNVQQILAGSIGKVGALYTVSLRLIDVESGEILKTVNEDCQCPIEQVLTVSMRNAALKLAGRMPSGGISVLGQGKGDLFIKTSPAGAKIYLDNMYTHKFSPATLQDIAAGKHFIKTVKGDYVGTKTVTVKANEVITETIPLEIAKGGLKIYSVPPEAHVFIDGRAYGKTPMIIKELSVGEHQIVFKLDPYEKTVKSVRVNANVFTKVNARLKKLADLSIQTDPSGAEIFIDGKLYGVTPKLIPTFPSGLYTLVLRKKGYALYQNKITVTAGSTQPVYVHLKKLTDLYIRSQPLGAKIFVNGKLRGKTPQTLKLMPGKPWNIKLSKTHYSDWERTLTLTEGVKMQINPHLEKEKGTLVLYDIPYGAYITINGKKYKTDRKEIPLPVGKYALTISRPGFIDKSFTVVINANQQKALYAALKKKTRSGAFVRSLFIPGWGQSYQDKTFRGWLFRLSFAGAAGGAYYYTQKYLKAKKEHWADHEINSLKKARDLSYQATAAVWMLNVLDALILPPSWNNRVQISGRMNRNGAFPGLTFYW